jgi:hypothetical protein
MTHDPAIDATFRADTLRAARAFDVAGSDHVALKVFEAAMADARARWKKAHAANGENRPQVIW